MATINGSTNSQYWTFKLEVTEGTPSVEDNTSPLTVDVYIGRTGNGSYMEGAKISCPVSVTGCATKTITYKNSNRVDIAVNKWLKIGSATFSDVPHNADGSKTVTVSASFTNNIQPKSGSASGSVTLTTIARASQPSCITYPENTQDVGDFGDTISIHCNRKSSAFTHTVRYKFGEQSGTIAEDVGTGTTWTIPLTLMNLIPNAVKGSGTIYLDTYNGTKLIGTKSCGFTATVPESIEPSCTMTLEDITGTDDTYGSPVQNLSKIKITINPTTAYSSPIKAYKITANGNTYTTASATTDVLKTAGNSEVTVTVTDSRGRSASASYTMNVQAYAKPTITKLVVARCNQDGTANRRGAYIKVTFSAVVSAMNDENSATYSLDYKKTSQGDSAYISIPLTAYKDNFSPTDATHIFAATTSSAYDVVITAYDNHNLAEPSTKRTKAPTGSAILSIRGFKVSNVIKDALGIGRIPDKAETLQVGWNTEFDKEVITSGNSYCFSTAGVAGTAGYILMAQITITAANADTPLTFVFSRRQAEAPMTVHIRFKNASGTAATVESIKYEGANYGAYLSPDDDTNTVYNLYVQKSSAYDTITLQNWFTSRTMGNRVSVSFLGTLVSAVPEPFYRATPAHLDSILDYIYPVGSVYISYSHNSPSTMFGGTWERISNAFLWGCDASGTIGQTGGEKTHKLTANELPKLSGYVNFRDIDNSNSDLILSQGGVFGGAKVDWSGSHLAVSTENKSTNYKQNQLNFKVGNDEAHNNMPPYIQVSMWRRTA